MPPWLHERAVPPIVSWISDHGGSIHPALDLFAPISLHQHLQQGQQQLIVTEDRDREIHDDGIKSDHGEKAPSGDKGPKNGAAAADTDAANDSSSSRNLSYRGVVALQDIPEGTVLMAIPLSCALHVPQALGGGGAIPETGGAGGSRGEAAAAGHASGAEDLPAEAETTAAAAGRSEAVSYLMQQQQKNLRADDRMLPSSHASSSSSTSHQWSRGTLRPFLATVLAAMSEEAKGGGGGEGGGSEKGSSSHYWPHLCTLPSEGCRDCLLYWSTEERRRLLKGTSIAPNEHNPEETPEQVFEREVKPVIAARPDLWPAPYDSLESFLRISSLVQSRGFHLEEENWVTGTKAEGSTLYLLPAIDMINHASDPSRRNCSLHTTTWPPSAARGVASVGGGAAVAAPSSSSDGASQQRQQQQCFFIKADRFIPGGTELLHTYGGLSDAQLLQAYGFVDSHHSCSSYQSGITTARTPGDDERKGDAADAAEGKKERGMGNSGAAAAPGRGGSMMVWNPCNQVPASFGVLREACRAALHRACEGDKEEMRDFDASLQSKVDLLVEGGLLSAPPSSLQPFLAGEQQQQQQLGMVYAGGGGSRGGQAPAGKGERRGGGKGKAPLAPSSSPSSLSLEAVDRSLFFVSMSHPLPDDLLTVVQVLLMSPDDVEELKESERKRRRQEGKTMSQAGEEGGDRQGGGLPNKRQKADRRGSSLMEKEEEEQTEGLEAPGGGSLSSPPDVLSLGTTLLEDEEEEEGMAQVVGMALIQVVDMILAGYPRTAKQDEEEGFVGSGARASSAAQVKAEGEEEDKASRARRLARLAAVVRCGEREVLRQMKKRAVMMMMGVVKEAAAPANAIGGASDSEGGEEGR